MQTSGALAAAWTKLADDAKKHAQIRHTLPHWQKDTDIVGMRSADTVAKLAAVR